MVMKMSRMVQTPFKRDHYADIAGYAACGWECVAEEENRKMSRRWWRFGR